jgi:hypothetical protein
VGEQPVHSFSTFPQISQDLVGLAISKRLVLVKQMNDFILLQPIEFRSNPEEGVDNASKLLLWSHLKAHCGGTDDYCGILVFEQLSHILPVSRQNPELTK